MAFFTLGISTQSRAQTSRLAIKKPTSGTGVTLDNESGGNTLFSIGGSEKMRLISTGGLSIGTTSSLENASLTLKDSNGGGWKHLALQGNSENWCMGVFGGGGFYIAKDGFSSAQTKFVLKGDNVGIGTTSPFTSLPNSGLHIDRGGHTSLILGNPVGGNYGGIIQTSDNRHRVFIGANYYDDGTSSWGSFSSGKGIAGISILADQGSSPAWGLSSIDFYLSNNDTNKIAMTIRDRGQGAKIGIGTTTPDKQLTINGTLGFHRNGVSPTNITVGYINYDNYLTIGTHSGVDGIQFKTGGTSNHTTKMWIANGGNVGIGTTTPNYKLEVAGTIKANNVPMTSDARFKKNIQTIDREAVAKLSQVRGTSYQFRTKEFKNKNFEEGKQLGLIAQELMKVYPELVSKGADGYYSVNYMGLIPVLVEAVKDLRKQNTQLKDNSQAIKAELDTLKSRMAALEKLLIKAKK